MGVQVAEGNTTSGYPDLNNLGKSHTARLVDGIPLNGTVVANDQLTEARAKKQIRERRLTSRTDAFRGKND